MNQSWTTPGRSVLGIQERAVVANAVPSGPALRITVQRLRKNLKAPSRPKAATASSRLTSSRVGCRVPKSQNLTMISARQWATLAPASPAPRHMSGTSHGTAAGILTLLAAGRRASSDAMDVARRAAPAARPDIVDVDGSGPGSGHTEWQWQEYHCHYLAVVLAVGRWPPAASSEAAGGHQCETGTI